VVAKLNAIEALQDRVREIERVMVRKGIRRGTTAQAKAIRFVIDHQDALQAIVGDWKSRGQQSATSN
jgi:hypothetical protein